MKQILIPTDFSANAWNAIRYATSLFKDVECTFYLLNVYTPAVFQSVEGVPAYVGMEDAAQVFAQNELNKTLDKIQNEVYNPKPYI